MEAEVIRVLAKSLSGSEHIVSGRVRNKLCEPWQGIKDARQHLESNGWTEIRFEIDRKIKDGIVRCYWDDQTITEHPEGSANFTYIRGGPSGGKKISKSDMP